MSADNTIVVLRQGQNFRVAHVQNAEVLYGDDIEAKKEYIRVNFGNKVYKTIEEAMVAAANKLLGITSRGGYVEYGIQIVQLRGFKLVGVPRPKADDMPTSYFVPEGPDLEQSEENAAVADTPGVVNLSEAEAAGDEPVVAFESEVSA